MRATVLHYERVSHSMPLERKHISTWEKTRVRELYLQLLPTFPNWKKGEKETESHNWQMEIHKYLLLLKITVLLKGELTSLGMSLIALICAVDSLSHVMFK